MFNKWLTFLYTMEYKNVNSMIANIRDFLVTQGNEMVT